jgi:hypothetical protein
MTLGRRNAWNSALESSNVVPDASWGGETPVVLHRSWVIGLALIGLGFVVLGGGAGAPSVAGAEIVRMAGQIPPIPAGFARVWFLRQFEPSESLQTPMIFVNDAPLASSQPGTIFFRDFAPGTYAFSVETCSHDSNQVARPSLAPGSETYLEIQVLTSFNSPDCFDDTFYVRAIPAEWAQRYFRQLTYLGAG